MAPPPRPERNGGHTNRLCAVRHHAAETEAEVAHVKALCSAERCSCRCHGDEDTETAQLLRERIEQTRQRAGNVCIRTYELANEDRGGGKRTKEPIVPPFVDAKIQYIEDLGGSIRVCWVARSLS
jgi:hypothetical protein